jgi:hypothetical protein
MRCVLRVRGNVLFGVGVAGASSLGGGFVVREGGGL